MLESIRRSAAIPHIPVRTLLSVGTVMSFGWLLANDLIHPLVLYLLQLYLAF
jgi:hypothetical protein